MRRKPSVAAACLLGLLLALVAIAEEQIEWDQARVAELAGKLHEGVKGLRDEIRRGHAVDIASMHAAAYYRLLDALRLIERESLYLQQSLEACAGREETLPTYARIALLRRDCAEEMRSQPLRTPARPRITQARSIVKQMDPYYGFDPNRPDHERALRRWGKNPSWAG